MDTVLEWRAGKVNAPSSVGAGSNSSKTEQNAKANPVAYKTATDSIHKALAALKLPASWLTPTLEIVARESSFNPTAKNPQSSARGLFQFLDSTRNDYAWDGVNWNDPYDQSVAGLKYIKDRYGSPSEALKHWDEHKWY